MYDKIKIDKEINAKYKTKINSLILQKENSLNLLDEYKMEKKNVQYKNPSDDIKISKRKRINRDEIEKMQKYITNVDLEKDLSLAYKEDLTKKIDNLIKIKNNKENFKN